MSVSQGVGTSVPEKLEKGVVSFLGFRFKGKGGGDT